jgi:hypothetical protein
MDNNSITIKVTYPGPLNTVLDKDIRLAIETIVGAKWTGQGTFIPTGERDITFKLKEMPKDDTKKIKCNLPFEKK